jgi:hypothetical protein
MFIKAKLLPPHIADRELKLKHANNAKDKYGIKIIYLIKK